MIINVQTLGTLLRSLQAGETAGRPGPLLPLAPTQAVKPVSSEDSTSQQAGAHDPGAGDAGSSARASQPVVDPRLRGRAAPPELPTARQGQTERVALPPGKALDPAVVVNIASAPLDLADAAGSAPAAGTLPASQLGRAPNTTVQATSAAPAPAAPAASSTTPAAQPGAASLRLSGAAQLVDVLARLPGGDPIRGAAPLTTGVPTPEALATGLAQSIARSGVFYESHLAGWALQRLPEAQLRLEPQASWPAAAVPVGAEGEAMVAPLAAPLANPEPGVPPTSSAAAAPAPGLLPATVPEGAPALVRQQLDVLETGQVLWRGDVWPGQPAQIEIAEERGGTAPDALPVWRTRLVLALPALGGVEASLALAGNRLQLGFSVTEHDSAALLAAELPALVGALAARAFEVAPVVMRDADRD